MPQEPIPCRRDNSRYYDTVYYKHVKSFADFFRQRGEPALTWARRALNEAGP
jgi:hypothetical protein